MPSAIIRDAWSVEESAKTVAARNIQVHRGTGDSGFMMFTLHRESDLASETF